MENGHTSPARLQIWGDHLMNKLAAVSRRKRKRQASKRRRSELRQEDRESGVLLARTAP